MLRFLLLYDADRSIQSLWSKVMLNILNLPEIYFRDACSWKYPNYLFKFQKLAGIIINSSKRANNTMNQNTDSKYYAVSL